MGYDDVCEAGGALRGLRSPWGEPPNSDLELVAEARARFLDLQNEAETLEEAYRSYQQRAVRSTISHMLPQRPLSPHHAQHPGSSLRKHISHLSNPYSTHQSKISHRSLSPQTTKISSSAPYDTRNTLPPARVTFLEDQSRPTSPGLFTEQSVHSWDEPLFSRDGHPQDGQSPPFRRLSSTPQSRRKLQGETAEGTFKDNFIVSQHVQVFDLQTSLNCSEINNKIEVPCYRTLKPFRPLKSIFFCSSLDVSISHIMLMLHTKSLPLLEAVMSLPFPDLSSDRQLSRAPNDKVLTSGDSSSELSSPHSPQLKSTARDPPRYHLAPLRQG